MKASDLLVKCLEEEGIEYIFGVPGEENADFMISLEQSGKINFVLTRHESCGNHGFRWKLRFFNSTTSRFVICR